MELQYKVELPAQDIRNDIDQSFSIAKLTATAVQILSGYRLK